ncbi:MAG: sensor histidine kinase [Bacteroidia bacterium]|nr:sensor histidine kinase [Bacteroidia bacterium]
MRTLNYFGMRLTYRLMVLLSITIVLGMILGNELWFFSQMVLGAIWILLAFELARFVHLSNNRIARFISSIRYDDLEQTTVRNSQQHASHIEKAIQHVTEELVNHKQRHRNELMLLEALVDSDPCALLVMDGRGDIIFQNEKFAAYNGGKAVSHSSQLNQSLTEVLSNMEQEIAGPSFIGLLLVGEREVHARIFSKQLHGQKRVFVRLSDMLQASSETESDQWLNLINVVNHEIRNGISPIASLTESLMDKVNAIPEPGQKRFFELGLSGILEQTRRLTDFTERHKKLVHIPPPKREWVLWSDILNEGLADSKSRVEVKIDGDAVPDRVRVDPGQFYQVLSNLAVNAERAMVSRPNPTIHCTVNRVNMDFVMSFSDNGCGVKAAMKHKIFVPFVTSHEQGSGLGLSICRKIIENHGGTIRLDRSDDEGTSFVVRISAIE